MKKKFTTISTMIALLAAVCVNGQYTQTFDGTEVPAEYAMYPSDFATDLSISDGKLALAVTSLNTGNQNYVGIKINLDLPISELPESSDSIITFTITSSVAVTAHVRGWLMVDDTIPANWHGGMVGMTGWWSQNLSGTALTPTFSIANMLKDPDIIAGLGENSRITSFIIDIGEGNDVPVTLMFDDITVATNFVNIAPYEVLISTNTIINGSAAGSLVGVLSTDDEETWQNHLYTLVAGEGDTDNASFSIMEDSLILNAAADMSTKADYSIRVQSYDLFGGSVEGALSLTVGNPAAVNDFNDPNDLRVFMNASSQIEITSQTADISRIVVYDLMGRVVADEMTNSRHHFINLDDTPNGLYFVNVQLGKEIITKKLIK
ncbi:MAG: T9SS type A sorting domain-containing protein [Bacteroidales bacterium]